MNVKNKYYIQNDKLMFTIKRSSKVVVKILYYNIDRCFFVSGNQKNINLIRLYLFHHFKSLK